MARRSRSATTRCSTSRPHLVDLALLLAGARDRRRASGELWPPNGSSSSSTPVVARARIRCADRPRPPRARRGPPTGRRPDRRQPRRRLAARSDRPDPGARASAGRLASRAAGARSPAPRAATDRGLLATAADGARAMAVIDAARRSGRRARRDLRPAVRRRERRGARPPAGGGPAAEPRRRCATPGAASSSRPRRATSPRAPSTRLYSGVELADHGIFYPFQWSAPRAARPLRDRVRRAARRSGSASPAPGCGRSRSIPTRAARPPRRTGVFVCGWGFADRVVLPRWSRPEAAAREHARRFGRGPGATEIFGRPRPRDLLAPARDAGRRARRGSPPLAEQLLARESFDLAWLTFSAAHLAGHQFWDLSQVDERGARAASRATLERRARRRLRGRRRGDRPGARRRCPPAADVIVSSAVGMDVNTSRADLLPEMLARGAGGRADRGRRRPGAIWRLRAAMPTGLRARGRRRDPRPGGARADRAARAARARLGDDPRLRPPGRQPGLRAAQPARPRARRDRRARGGRGAAATRSPPGWRPSRPGRRAARSPPSSAWPTGTRGATPTAFPTSSCAGRTAGDHASPSFARSASARSGASGARQRDAPVTTPPATPGRSSRPATPRSRRRRAPAAADRRRRDGLRADRGRPPDLPGEPLLHRGRGGPEAPSRRCRSAQARPAASP